jgi:hypothetical protein
LQRKHWKPRVEVTCPKTSTPRKRQALALRVRPGHQRQVTARQTCTFGYRGGGVQWQSTCLASTGPQIQVPVPPKINQKVKESRQNFIQRNSVVLSIYLYIIFLLSFLHKQSSPSPSTVILECLIYLSVYMCFYNMNNFMS